MSSTITNFDNAGNQVVRFDVNGHAVDAHEGQIALFGDTYYFYGTSFSCGWAYWSNTRYCGFKAYSSPDLVHWTDHGYLFDAQSDYWQSSCRGPSGCFRPHVIYNARTKRYVLWFNANQNSDSSGYHVFDSDAATGPFVERAAPKLAVSYVNGINGDENLFVNDDGTAYLVYTDWTHAGDIIVEQLDSTDESGTGRFVRLGLNRTEAPAMFKRGGRYYIVVSDPNCPYCTTGTAYMTAPTPLGPWTGVGAPQDYWRVLGGVLTVDSGDGGLSASGRDWTDYRFSFDTTPLTPTVGDTAPQSGWLVRAQNPTNAYLWNLSTAEGGMLVKKILKGGQLQEIGSAIALAPTLHIQAGQSYHVEMDVAGQTITTLIDGRVVDVTHDSTYTQGRVGFYERTADNAAAAFDNAQVTLPDGTTPLTDTFAVTDTSSTSDEPFQFDPPLRPRAPIVLSGDSCGGQPANVAVIPSADGPLYLYQSDLWHNGGRNEGVANYYWGPLSFNADGSIQPIACAASFTANLTVGAPGSQAAPPDLDQTSGVDDFRTACDIGGPVERLQTFTPTRTGLLTNVLVATFQDWTTWPFPNAPLLVDIVAVAGTTPSFPLARVAVPTDNIPWAAGDVAVQPNIMVTAGRRYGILVHTSSTQGCYGFASNDANPYPNGTELHSGDGGATFTVEQGRALQFAVTVAQGSTIPTSTPFPTDTSPASATPIPTAAPTDTPLPTATPTLIPTAMDSSPPSPTATPTDLPMPPTATLTTTPIPTVALPSTRPTAHLRNSMSHSPSINVSSERSVVSGGVLPVRVRTTPRAHLALTLRVTTTKVTTIGRGKQRKQVRRTVVLYQTTVTGITDAHGLFTRQLRITYKPAAPIQATLIVTAHTESMISARTMQVIIVPPLDIAVTTQASVVSGSVLPVRIRTVPRAQLTLTLRVTTTRVVTTGHDKRHKQVRRTVVLYQTATKGVTDAHGQFMGRIHVAYNPAAPVWATLTVTARSVHATSTRMSQIAVQLLHRH